MRALRRAGPDAAGPADTGPLPMRGGARRPGAGRRQHRDRPVLGIGGPLDESEDEYGVDEDGDKPAANDMRFVARTEAGMRLLDARGKPMDLPPQQHIGQFRHGYALAYAQGAARIVDRAGKLYELPDFFEAEVAGPWPGALPEHRRRGRSLGPVRLHRRQGGLAAGIPAHRHVPRWPGRGRAGREPRRHHRHAGQVDRAARVPRGAPGGRRLRQLRQAGAQTEEYLRPSALASRDGRVLTPLPRIWRWRRTRPAATWPGPTSACGRSRATRRRSGKSPTPTSRRWAAGWASSAATGSATSTAREAGRSRLSAWAVPSSTARRRARCAWATRKARKTAWSTRRAIPWPRCRPATGAGRLARTG